MKTSNPKADSQKLTAFIQMARLPVASAEMQSQASEGPDTVGQTQAGGGQTHSRCARKQATLANLRYEGAATNYLEVVSCEQELFTTKHGLSPSRRNEFLSVIRMYRALASGWAESAALHTDFVQTTK